MYRQRKTVKRHRALVTGMAAVLLTLVVGLSLATWQWRVAEERSREATNQRIEAGLARDGEHAQRAIADAKSREAIESSRKLKEEVLISTTRLGLSRLQEGDSVVAVQEAAQLARSSRPIDHQVAEDERRRFVGSVQDHRQQCEVPRDELER